MVIRPSRTVILGVYHEGSASSVYTNSCSPKRFGQIAANCQKGPMSGSALGECGPICFPAACAIAATCSARASPPL